MWLKQSLDKKKKKRKEIKVKELQIHHEKLYSKAFAG